MSLWRGIRRNVPAEVRDEIEAHIALAAADLQVEGWSREAALEEARRRFGDRERIEREMVTIDEKHDARTRRIHFLTDLGKDVRLAFRQLRRRPAFALAAILVIALGIGANSAVFAVVDGALFRPLPLPGGDRMVVLWDKQEDEEGLPASLAEYRDWERQNDFLDGSIAIYFTGMRLAVPDGWDTISVGQLAGDPHRALGAQPLLGRWFTADEMKAAAHVALLDESTWRERYAGSRDVIGQRVDLGDGPYTIVGVAPHDTDLLRGFFGSRGAVKLWLPFQEAPNMDRGIHFLLVVGRLKDGLSFDGARQSAALLAQNLRDSKVTEHGLTIQRARDALIGEERPLFLVLAGAALFVLLIVCANLANLFLSKFQERAREFAVRAALGATRGRLVRQVLTESIVLGILGGAAGLALAQVMMGLVSAVAHQAATLAPSSSLDARVVGFTVLASIVVGLLFGLGPALRAGRLDVGSGLKEASLALTSTRRGRLRRKILVGAEVALSVTLLAGTGLLVRTLAGMLAVQPGSAVENVLTMHVLLDEERYKDDAKARALVAEMRARAAALPGVVGVGAGTTFPLDNDDVNGGFRIPGRDFPKGQEPSAKKRIVTPGYLEALDIPLRAGRVFNDGDRAGAADVVIISESIARRFWPDGDAVGKAIGFGWGPGETQTIIGVVGDVRHEGLDRPADGTLYRPFEQFPSRGFGLVVRSTVAPATMEREVRSAFSALESSISVFDVHTMAELRRTSIAPRRSLLLVLGGFALIALILAAVGTYAVTAQAVTQRTREIGLRMACGARESDILRMVLGEGGLVILAGVVVGLAGALAATRVLSHVLYAVSPGDPPTLAVAAIVLALISIVAVYLPARRAAKLDPMIALRNE